MTGTVHTVMLYVLLILRAHCIVAVGLCNLVAYVGSRPSPRVHCTLFDCAWEENVGKAGRHY